MIAIGCDHGALELKEQLIEHLKKRGVECKDYGLSCICQEGS